MKIYLATVLEDGERENKAGTTMTKKRYIYRLISYFVLRNLKITNMKEYVLTGVIKK